MTEFSRRQAILLGLSPLVAIASGCRSSLPHWPAESSSHAALTLLHDSATAHGLPAYRAISDLNVSYSGQWRWLVGKLQPDLVDPGFRGGSQERLLLREGIIAQSHLGPKGHKQVVRNGADAGERSIHVWFNDSATRDHNALDAAALVADAYALFLLGPMLLAVNTNPHRDIRAELAGTAKVRQADQTHVCDILRLELQPGFGNSSADQIALFIDRDTRLMRRVRMTINGLESTRGALVDVDTSDHQSLHGILWPTLFHERLLRPAPLDVHVWHLTGLDINRGETGAELLGPAFSGRAAAPAAPLPTGNN